MTAKATETADTELSNTVSLPRGWLWVTLGEVARVVMGNSPPGTSYNEAGRGLPLINGPTEFGPGALDHPTARQFTEDYSRTCLPGDLLVCVRGSTTGRTNVASFEAAIGRGIASIRAFELQPYINHFVWSRTEALLAISSGSTFPSISIAQLRELNVPLPPLDEQNRIVAAIDAAMTDIDTGIARLSHARADLTRLRGAILRSAMSGELTARYRAERLDSNASVLRPPELGQPRGRQPSLVEPVVVEPPSDALPPSWRWTSFGEVCEVRLGRSKSPSNRAGEFATPYLRAANIGEDGLRLDDVLTMDFPPREQEVYRLRAGDLVIAEASGSVNQVGKPAMWHEEMPLCCYQNTVIRLRPVSILPAFVLAALQHCYFNGVFSGLSAGVGINHLGASRLSGIQIPMPPAVEQQAIAKEVALQLKAMVQSRQAIDRTLVHAEQLRRSVWKRAFSGCLVETSEDPAIVTKLLKAVRARLTDLEAAKSAARPQKAHQTRKDTKVRTPLREVLMDHPGGISPERLFTLAGFKTDNVDEFYAELASISDNLVESRPADDKILQWPRVGEITVRLKEV